MTTVLSVVIISLFFKRVRGAPCRFYSRGLPDGSTGHEARARGPGYNA